MLFALARKAQRDGTAIGAVPFGDARCSMRSVHVTSYVDHVDARRYRDARIEGELAHRTHCWAGLKAQRTRAMYGPTAARTIVRRHGEAKRMWHLTCRDLDMMMKQ